jgi:hypothetical protein
MIKVYRPDGVAEQKEPVDARECVERCGYSYEQPAPVPEELNSEGDTGKKKTKADA